MASDFSARGLGFRDQDLGRVYVYVSLRIEGPLIGACKITRSLAPQCCKLGAGGVLLGRVLRRASAARLQLLVASPEP